MLKNDKPVLVALLAIAFALFLNIGVSFAENPQAPQSKTSTQISTKGKNEPSPESREATATEIIADYTIKLACLTGVLAAIGIVTSGLALWQILLARAEFTATHRPRLRIRNIQTDGPGGATFVLLANVGESTAEITGTAGAFVMRNAVNRRWLGGRPDLSKLGIPPQEIRTLVSGQARSIMLSMGVPDPNEIKQIAAGVELLLVVGVIKYADSNGIERTTGFGWTYDPVPQEFINPEKTTEYNYED